MKRRFAAFIFSLFATVIGGTALAAGKDAIDIKDADGKAYVKEYRELAKSKSSGWSNYKRLNPVSQ